MFSKIRTGFKAFLCYWLPFLPCSPAIGRVEQGDCVFVQAFGRNTIPDEELGETVWKAIRKGNSLSETFTFLNYNGKKVEPGQANEALAERAMRLAEQYDIPIIAQWEVIYAIWQLHRRWFLENKKRIDCIWPPQQGYFATYDVKLQSREKMRERGKSNPIEVCHPAMKARAVPIIWGMGIDVIAEGVAPWNFWRNETWKWDAESVQPWTRGFLRPGVSKKNLLRNPLQAIKGVWLPREFAGRIHHLFKGWVSFVPAESKS